MLLNLDETRNDVTVLCLTLLAEHYSWLLLKQHIPQPNHHILGGDDH